MLKGGPDSFREDIRRKAAIRRERITIGDNRTLAKLATRFGISSEEARGILRKEGWILEPTRSEALKVWRPPSPPPSEEG